MKYIISFLFCLISLFSSANRIILPKLADASISISNGAIYSPTDTLCIDANLNPYSFFYGQGIHGSAAQSIVIININGKAIFSKAATTFSLNNCTYIKVMGDSAYWATRDGISSISPVGTKGGVGYQAYGYSRCIEFVNLRADNKSYSSWVKNEITCDSALTYWKLDSISMHHCILTNSGYFGTGQAGYWGSTDPLGLDVNRYIICNGQKRYAHYPDFLPSQLSNILFYDNIVDSTGRSGFQLSNARSGTNKIYGNIFTRNGANFEANGQGCAISLGGFTRGEVYDNTTDSSYTQAIQLLGSGLIWFHDNIVGSSGDLMGHHLTSQASIFMDTRTTLPVDSTQFILENNILGHNTDVDIHGYKTHSTYNVYGNKICNNFSSANNAQATIIMASGINYSTNCAVSPVPYYIRIAVYRPKQYKLFTGGL